jgi:glutamate/aspartate transport system substrate-binding protein
MKLELYAIATATMLAVAASQPAVAQAPGGTLAKIKDSGEIAFGHRDSSIPFSYLDDQQKPIGFAMDLCGRIADAVKADLKLPSLKVKLQPIQLSNQIPLIQNGSIDIVCGPATNNWSARRSWRLATRSSFRAFVRSSKGTRGSRRSRTSVASRCPSRPLRLRSIC